LALGIIALANTLTPPLRMPFGSDAVAAIEAKHAFVEKELAQWRALSLSTDFAAAAADAG
jgi:hypothetical protein